jgi:hypothetical protein
MATPGIESVAEVHGSEKYPGSHLYPLIQRQLTKVVENIYLATTGEKLACAGEQIVP